MVMSRHLVEPLLDHAIGLERFDVFGKRDVFLLGRNHRHDDQFVAGEVQAADA
jgi:hypothetical protein